MRIPSLDGLRACAIILVLIAHSWIAHFGVAGETFTIFTIGMTGVLIFFVLSGYLITTLMLREKSLDLHAFYVRRSWRIFPVAFAYLTVITIWRYQYFSWPDLAWSWTFLSAYGALFKSFPWDLSHLWSLSNEEQFYLFWPLLLAAGLTSCRRSAWIAVLAAPLFRYWFSGHNNGLLVSFSFPWIMDSLATGCLAAIYHKPLSAFVSKHPRLGWIWLLALVAPFLLYLGNHCQILWPLPQVLGHLSGTIFNFSVALGILWAIAFPPRLLNHPVMVWIGTISYGLYVWHMPFFNPSGGIAFPLNLFLAFVVASASYYLLEQPIYRWRRTQPHMRNEPTPRCSPTAP